MTIHFKRPLYTLASFPIFFFLLMMFISENGNLRASTYDILEGYKRPSDLSGIASDIFKSIEVPVKSKSWEVVFQFMLKQVDQIPVDALKLQSPSGRIAIPDMILNRDVFSDKLISGLAYQFTQDKFRMPAMNYLLASSFVYSKSPEFIYERMLQRSTVPEVTLEDALLQAVAIESICCHNYIHQPNYYGDWRPLMDSPKPTCQFMGLLMLAYSGLSPDELLMRYRQALFHSCSFVEHCVIRQIEQLEDRRNSVVELLEEYLSPQRFVMNDGTAPDIGGRMEFRLDVLAKRVLSEMRDQIAKHGEHQPLIFPKRPPPTNRVSSISSVAKAGSSASSSWGAMRWLLLALGAIGAGIVCWRSCNKGQYR